MTRRRRQRRKAVRKKFLPGLLVLIAGVGGMVTLLSFSTVTPTHLREKRVVPAATHVATAKLRTAATPNPFPSALFAMTGQTLPPDDRKPRRVPVSGAEGYTVMLNPDGTSYLESPDGKKTQLVDRTFARTPSEKELEERIRQRLLKPPASPRKQAVAVGQLVVLDEGVVDVPRDSLITFTGSDRLVTLNPDGTATVYWADGRTEVRDRQRPAPSLLPSRKLPTPSEE